MARRTRRPRSAVRSGRVAADATAEDAAPPLAALLAVFLVAAFVVYAPALGGAMFSDDSLFVGDNPYVQDVTWDDFVAILDPASPLPQMVAAWSPVTLLLHAGAWQAFGAEVQGHHVINVALHALASALLALFLARCGVPGWTASLGGLLFLVHPANVEAVAWISQLKTPASLVLVLLALLVHPRRPVLAVLLFALGLLAKPTAATAFFVVAGLGWLRGGAAGRDAGAGWRWPFVAAWGGVLLAYAPAYLYAFSPAIPDIAPLYEGTGVRVRSVLAVGLRYLVMAATGAGTGAFHEPPAARSLLDPWWLASLPVLGALIARIVVVVRRRSVEFVFGLWAASWYAVVCGIVPLPFPLADRHLYFILPGLIGAACCCVPEAARWLVARTGADLPPGRLRQVGLCAGVVLAVAFGVHSRGLAVLYGQPGQLFALAAERYPEGTVAMRLRANQAAWRGDVDATLRELRGMRVQYKRVLFDVLVDPTYAAVRDAPRFQAFLEELARAHLAQRDVPRSQFVLRQDALAYLVLGQRDAMERALREGLELGGPISDQLRADLEAMQSGRL